MMTQVLISVPLPALGATAAQAGRPGSADPE
jgi:hypothetical protein